MKCSHCDEFDVVVPGSASTTCSSAWCKELEVRDLRDALARYGCHDHECPVSAGASDAKCTCGLRAFLPVGELGGLIPSSYSDE